jgi:hypothetical protein
VTDRRVASISACCASIRVAPRRQGGRSSRPTASRRPPKAAGPASTKPHRRRRSERNGDDMLKDRPITRPTNPSGSPGTADRRRIYGRRGRYVAFGTLLVAVCRPAEALCADTDAKAGVIARPVRGCCVAVERRRRGLCASPRPTGATCRLGLQARLCVARVHLTRLTSTASSEMSKYVTASC